VVALVISLTYEPFAKVAKTLREQYELELYAIVSASFVMLK